MDQALKQRLVGATVLIILGVVLLPMLLSGQPESHNESGSIQVPDKPPELSIATRRFPIGEQVAGQPSTVVEQSPAVEPSATVVELPEPVAGTPVGDAADQHTSAPTEAGLQADQAEEIAGAATLTVAEGPPSEPDEDSGKARAEASAAFQNTAAGGRYLVQVASFSNTSNVNQLSGVLRENGLPVLTDTVDAAAGLLHRVRVGPYDDLAGATAAMDRIGALMSDLNPRVVDLRPDEHAPVTDPGDPMVRWVVQAGSFGDSANAEQLVAQLRLNDFPAYTETIRSASGTVYKVRIGPLVERQGAVELAERLSSRMKIDGMIMSVD